jgi:hypothetical protein
LKDVHNIYDLVQVFKKHSESLKEAVSEGIIKDSDFCLPDALKMMCEEIIYIREKLIDHMTKHHKG